MSTNPTGDRTDREPVLDLHQIQGNILVPFGTPFQSFLYLALDRAHASAWVARTLPEITSTRSLIDAHRAGGPRAAVGLSLSASGLRALGARPDALLDVPFQDGLAARSTLLGDPHDPDDPGTARHWPTGGPDTTADALLVVGADTAEAVGALTGRLLSGPGAPRLLHHDRCATRPGPDGDREHFGYRDPVSQPAVRGVAADTGEPLCPVSDPARPDEALPGQMRLWPGEFVFGHPGQDPVAFAPPGPVASGGPGWTDNGSLLVVRRYRQDVAGFLKFAARTSAELERRGFPGWSPDAVSARLFGRWRDGTPLSVSPKGPDPSVSACPSAVNDFGFTPLRGPVDDTAGHRVPVGAHIRKAYPRDHATDLETLAGIETHRLMRRGVPYTGADGETGMAFACYQTSIERQFEFVVRSWLNNPYQQHEGDNHDPVVGRPHRPVGDAVPREFVFRVPSDDPEGTAVRIPMPRHFTVPRGGGYFLTPSLSALETLSAPSPHRPLGGPL